MLGYPLKRAAGKRRLISPLPHRPRSRASSRDDRQRERERERERERDRDTAESCENWTMRRCCAAIHLKDPPTGALELSRIRDFQARQLYDSFTTALRQLIDPCFLKDTSVDTPTNRRIADPRGGKNDGSALSRKFDKISIPILSRLMAPAWPRRKRVIKRATALANRYVPTYVCSVTLAPHAVAATRA